MTRRQFERRLGLTTLAAIAVITALAFAPATVRIVVIVAFFLAYLGGLAYAFRDRPLTDLDLYCAAVDEDLDRLERERRHRALRLDVDSDGFEWPRDSAKVVPIRSGGGFRD